MKIWNSDFEIGAAIHRQVVAEGGWMVHSGERSFFERRLPDGTFTRKFSAELMSRMLANGRALKVYAASRRASMARIGAEPPGIGSSEAPATAKPKTRRSASLRVQRKNRF